MEWLTAQNINDWMDTHKKYLIEQKYVKRTRCLWFVNTDETNHKFSTDGPKGGPATQRHHNPSFNRCGDRVVKSNRHTTGVYATNPFEALPFLRRTYVGIAEIFEHPEL